MVEMPATKLPTAREHLATDELGGRPLDAVALPLLRCLPLWCCPSAVALAWGCDPPVVLRKPWLDPELLRTSPTAGLGIRGVEWVGGRKRGSPPPCAHWDRVEDVERVRVVVFGNETRPHCRRGGAELERERELKGDGRVRDPRAGEEHVWVLRSEPEIREVSAFRFFAFGPRGRRSSGVTPARGCDGVVLQLGSSVASCGEILGVPVQDGCVRASPVPLDSVGRLRRCEEVSVGPKSRQRFFVPGPSTSEGLGLGSPQMIDLPGDARRAPEGARRRARAEELGGERDRATPVCGLPGSVSWERSSVRKSPMRIP